MRQVIFALLWSGLLGLAITSCRKNDPFLVEKYHAGPVDSTTTLNRLPALFPSDSIGQPHSVKGLHPQTAVSIYKTGSREPVMEIYFTGTGDSLKLHAVEISDDSYHTARGLRVTSPFKEWRRKYRIDRVETSLRHVVVFVPELRATLVFPYDALAQTAQYRVPENPGPEIIKPGARPESIVLFFDTQP